MDQDQALALLAAAPVLHLAATDAEGLPILRALNFAISSGAVVFHGSPVGEKIEAVGRPAVLSVEETVATVPSYFSDLERACPATTLYRSVQVHGLLEEVTDPRAKAAALQALMEKYQPEGGHVPITAEHPLYKKPVEGVMVLRVSLERVDGKSKLGQNRRPEEVVKLIEALWRRGAAGDARAVDLMAAANPSAAPQFLSSPPGVRLRCALEKERAAEAVELLRDAYWNVNVPAEVIAKAHLGASAWVGAVDAENRLIATARAISDGTKWAAVFDVMVAPAWRGRGLGDAVVRLLLSHPAVRAARRVWLATRDAQPFYKRLGFCEGNMLPPRSFNSTEMVLSRDI